MNTIEELHKFCDRFGFERPKCYNHLKFYGKPPNYVLNCIFRNKKYTTENMFLGRAYEDMAYQILRDYN